MTLRVLLVTGSGASMNQLGNVGNIRAVEIA
jgi:hypothetical protein